MRHEDIPDINNPKIKKAVLYFEPILNGYKKKAYKKIAKDRKVIPDPIDDRKFQEW